jgi:hypothetical protein
MADREQLYQALRNADAAGDVDGARKLAAYIRTVGYDAASAPTAGEQPSVLQTGDAAHAGGDQGRRIAQLAEEALHSKSSLVPGIGVGEGLLNVATGLGSTAVGGIAGLARTIYNLPSEGFDRATELGAQTAHTVQSAGTYQPRTPIGKIVSELASVPLGAAKEAGREIGGDIGQFAGGKQGRVAGESIGDVVPDLAATLAGGVAARAGARAIASRESVPIPGKDYSPLRDLSLEEQARMQRMTDQGIEPTLGQVTRDPQQFRFEDQTGKTQEGAALRERELDSNDALINAVQATDDMRAGRATAHNEREAGAMTARALEENANNSLKNMSDLYDKAKNSGETEVPVNTYPLEKFLAENRAESVAVPALRAIADKLEFLKEQGDGVVTINGLENLYKSAGKLQQTDASAASFMREVKSQINDITEGVGGDLYREARQARLAHAMEFEDRGAVARLIDKKAGSRTDYKTASEDVFNKTVINSSLSELQDVTNSLLSRDPATSPQSWQAVRELQAQTIAHLVEKATEKGVPNERGAPGFSPTSFRNAVNNIGRDKLEWLLGSEAVTRLENAMRNAQDIKQAPGKVSGSDTSLNMRDAAERMALDDAKKHLFSRVPGVSTVARYLQNRAAAVEMQRRISDALTPRRASAAQIQQMAKDAETEQRRQTIANAARMAGPVAPMAMATSGSASRPEMRAPIGLRKYAPLPGPHLVTPDIRAATARLRDSSDIDVALAAVGVLTTDGAGN